jgi:antitoxin component YwqK of YwqJK toxin-antitoxin module/Tfp pilus assembly protein PilF
MKSKKKFVQNYKDGVKHGEQLEHHRFSEQVKSIDNYVNGRRDGKQLYYYKDGNIRSESYYTKGVEDGLGKSYYESGKLLKEVLYRGGRQQYMKGYFESGQLRYEWLHDKDKKFITHIREYDESGNLMAKGQQYGPTLIGNNYAYYPDGSIKLEVEIKGKTNKDSKITQAIFYDSKGALHPANQKMIGTFFDFTTANIKDSWIKDPLETCKDAACFIDAGISYKKIKQTDRAIALFNEAIRIKPDSATGYKRRGDTYQKSKQYEKALADYSEAIRIKPDYTDAYYARGHTYKFALMFEQAIADFRETARLKPKSAMVNNALAWALATVPSVESRNGKQAIEYALKAIALKPKAGYFDTLGAAYVESKQYGKAVKAYESAIEKSGSKGIKSYQKYLQDKGYYQGELDGENGAEMREAMVACINDGCKLGVD